MTINDFVSIYYLHDSLITHISYLNQIVSITIEFCNWAQTWYQDKEPEIENLILSFKDVEKYDGLIGDLNYYSILDVNYHEPKLDFFICDDYNDDYFHIVFEATSVNVEKAPPKS